jgi:sulfhydrogenase subunit beta (sulfur reductase)
MDRTGWVLSETEMRAWLQGLVEGDRTVVAPVAEDGLTLFRPIAAADHAVVEPRGKTRWSPKEFLFPRTEALYRYTFKGSTVTIEDPAGPERPQVLFGVRSCDAAGLARLDEIFLSGRKDPLYAARREATTVVAAGCAAADPECFCTAVGGSPVGTEGADLQLLPLADGSWLLTALTDKGEALVGEAAASWGQSGKKEHGRSAELEQSVSEQIARNPIQHEWSALLEAGFESPAWDRLAEHCLGCSICAYVCPSCSCFDMNHDANAWCGEQCRSWDACTFGLFTLHASGHNPRETRGERYRQRVLHKFSFTGEGEDHFRCVGCGRCVALCPAGLDIGEIVTAAAAAITEEGADAAR